MITCFRALRSAQSAVKTKPSQSFAKTKKSVVSRFLHPVITKRSCTQIAQSHINPLEVQSDSIAHLDTVKTSSNAHIEDHFSEIRSILKLVPTNALKASPATILEISEKISEELTPGVLKSLGAALRADSHEVQTLCITIGTLYLRCGNAEAANRFISEIATQNRRLEDLFNRVWVDFITSDVHHEDLLAHRLLTRQLHHARHTPGSHVFGFSTAGIPASIATIASSITLAIEYHDITPSTTALTSLVLLTLRMLPADLKSIRQQVVRKETPKEQLGQWKSKLEAETSLKKDEHIESDLLPSSAVQFVPTMASVYQTSSFVPLKRPIPIEKSHRIAQSALQPIWDLLRSELDVLTPYQLLSLARGFKKATLVQPALQLVPALEKFSFSVPRKQLGLLLSIYEEIFETLCNDVQYDEVYRIYKSQLYDTSKKTYKSEIQSQHKLASWLLQGVSRSPKASREEKDELYLLTGKSNFISPAALTSYCYSLARTVEVTSEALLEVVDTQSGKQFDRQNLRYLNEIFFGLSMRGSFSLAHEILSSMWNLGSVINAQAIDLFLDRCITSRQPDLVNDILALMRPLNPISLHGETGKRSITTSKHLPVHLSITSDRYFDLFSLYASFNRIDDFKRALEDYNKIDGHLVNRTFLRRLLLICTNTSSITCMEHVMQAFKQAGLPLGLSEANDILKTYQKSENRENFISFFNSLPALGIKPDERSFASKVHFLSQSFQADLAIEVLEEMQDAGISATAQIFESLIYVLAPISVEKAEWVLQHMNSLNIKPTLKLYTPLLNVYAQQQNEAMFQLHLDFATQSTGLPLHVSFCRTVAICLSTLNKSEMIDTWLIPLMKREGVDIHQYPFVSAVLAAYHHAGKDEAAEQLILALPNLKSLPTKSVTVQHLFKPAIEKLAKESLERLGRFFSFLRTSCGIPLSHNLYAIVIDVLSHQPNASQKDAALAWIQSEMHPSEFAAFTKTINAR